MTRFAVILLKTPQHGLAVGNRNIVGPIMPYKYKAFLEINGMKLRKTAANTQPIKKSTKKSGFSGQTHHTWECVGKPAKNFRQSGLT